MLDVDGMDQDTPACAIETFQMPVNGTKDPISAIAASDKALVRVKVMSVCGGGVIECVGWVTNSCFLTSLTAQIICRESGIMLRYSLPHITLESEHSLEMIPFLAHLNCDSSRASIIDINGVLSMFDFNEQVSALQHSPGEVGVFVDGVGWAMQGMGGEDYALWH